MRKFTNLGELILYQNKNFANPHFLNYKVNQNYNSFSNQEFFRKITQFAIYLEKIGIKAGDKFANYSYQNPLWLIADFAGIVVGAITVPIFNNISNDNLFFELKDSQTKFLFIDNPQICDLVHNNFPEIKIITCGFKVDYAESFENIVGVELDKKSSKASEEHIADLIKNIKPSDIVTIVYTSGSTSLPKGVEISHEALVSQIHDSDEFFNLKSSEIVLSYLPLAHIFERMVMMYYISKGLSIYFVDDIKKLGICLQEIRPTLMTSVPRALEKVFAKINNSIEEGSGVKKFLGRIALNSALKKKYQSNKSPIDHILDLLVYKKFRLALGGKINMIICGGSPLSNDLENFYWNIGVKVYCGYGLTECSPVISTNCPNNHKFTTVGKKFSSLQIKIADDNELLVKGINVMKQYHHQPAKTAEAFNADGWFKTGDLASIDEEGYLKIIGRKKELFKTSNGKFVHPILLEQQLVQNLGFLQGAIVIAEAKPFVSVLLFIDYELLNNLKKRIRFNQDNEKLFASTELKNYIDKAIDNINNKLDHWEQIKQYRIITQPISIEAGDITPSMKLKRNALEQKFSKVINEIYQ